LPESLVESVVTLRQQHLPGYEIARRTGASAASVSRILRRAKLSRWRDLHPGRRWCATSTPRRVTSSISTSRA